jgi:hypothetical protein
MNEEQLKNKQLKKDPPMFIPIGDKGTHKPVPIYQDQELLERIEDLELKIEKISEILKGLNEASARLTKIVRHVLDREVASGIKVRNNN